MEKSDRITIFLDEMPTPASLESALPSEPQSRILLHILHAASLYAAESGSADSYRRPCGLPPQTSTQKQHKNGSANGAGKNSESKTEEWRGISEPQLLLWRRVSAFPDTVIRGVRGLSPKACSERSQGTLCCELRLRSFERGLEEARWRPRQTGIFRNNG